jgi:carboxyl-terminal processing protease
MLVNRGTRSGKEVLAFGFKEYHLGEIIGTQTAGAVLAASAFLMDNGDLLLLAVADVTIDGQRLEGVASGRRSRCRSIRSMRPAGTRS